MINFNYKINNSIIEVSYPHYYECDKNWYNNPESETRNYVINQLNDNFIVIDAGAQIGLYSILFSKICKNGKVYCFEPTDTFELLKKNCEYNNCDNVVLINKPLSNKLGNYEDKIFKIWSQQIIDTKIFDFETIDNFIKENNLIVDFIKIDVDSYDYEVLLGSKNTLLNQSPIVLVELNYALEKRGYTPKDAIDFMLSVGYNIDIILDGQNYVFKKK
jgi:FkbM family methyltransferase